MRALRLCDERQWANERGDGVKNVGYKRSGKAAHRDFGSTNMKRTCLEKSTDSRRLVSME